MFGKSTLKLCYVVMAEDGRLWLGKGNWGSADGNDMCDAEIFFSKKKAEKQLEDSAKPGSVFEIGLYNGRPVMLVDSYSYWLDAKYGKPIEK